MTWCVNLIIKEIIILIIDIINDIMVFNVIQKCIKNRGYQFHKGDELCLYKKTGVMLHLLSNQVKEICNTHVKSFKSMDQCFSVENMSV